MFTLTAQDIHGVVIKHDPDICEQYRIVKWFCDVASTLAARDYKGICNQGVKE